MRYLSKLISIIALLTLWQTSFALQDLLDTNHATDWSYEGKDGPASWGAEDPEDMLCQVGKHQSPIDIPQLTPVKGAALIFHYGIEEIDMMRDTHNVYVYFEHAKVKPYIMFSGVRYDLVALHFHTPSEHTIQHRKYPLELHLVHQSRTGNVLVVAVMFKEGRANSFLRRWLFGTQLPKLNEELYISGHKLNLNQLLPKENSYYSYTGSLTIPKCQEEVTWVIIKEPMTASARQIEAFKNRVMPFNARPTQPLNNRNVILTQ